MPVFYFDLANGIIEEDLDGVDLPNARAARSEAVRLGGELILENPDGLLRDGAIRVNVTDDSNRFVCTVQIQIIPEDGASRLDEPNAQQSRGAAQLQPRGRRDVPQER